MTSDRPKATDIRRAGMDLLARREHSVEELKRKLSKRFGREPEVLESIATELERLVAEGLLSDERHAESLIRQLIGKGVGPRRLDQELRSRGIGKVWEQCAAAAELSVDWFDKAEQVYRKKYGHQPMPYEHSAALRERGKRARFMQYRGFEPDHFMHLLTDDGGSDNMAEE